MGARALPDRSAAAARLRSWRWGKTARKPAKLPVDALHQLWQDRAGMNENKKQFSFTRAASSTSGRAKNKIPISFFAMIPKPQNISATFEP
jgi:hypothetical protein